MARSITNIRSLKGMGIFADRARGTGSLNFRRYNLIYGFNGSGKSTLSRLFASLEAETFHSRLPEEAEFEIELDDGAVFGLTPSPPGYIETDMSRGGIENPEWFPIWRDMTPMGRVGQPEEVASAALGAKIQVHSVRLPHSRRLFD
jgi:energy-coupling factor transporter ATP-binding protein EcfA2